MAGSDWRTTNREILIDEKLAQMIDGEEIKWTYIAAIVNKPNGSGYDLPDEYQDDFECAHLSYYDVVRDELIEAGAVEQWELAFRLTELGKRWARQIEEATLN